MAQGGDVINQNGTGTESIYGKYFKDENFQIKHDKPYLLSMANCGPNTNGCQFFITFVPCPWLDGKHVAFGEVIMGFEVMDKLKKVASMTGRTKERVTISNCGARGTVKNC